MANLDLLRLRIVRTKYGSKRWWNRTNDTGADAIAQKKTRRLGFAVPPIRVSNCNTCRRSAHQTSLWCSLQPAMHYSGDYRPQASRAISFMKGNDYCSTWSNVSCAACQTLREFAYPCVAFPPLRKPANFHESWRRTTQGAQIAPAGQPINGVDLFWLPETRCRD